MIRQLLLLFVFFASTHMLHAQSRENSIEMRRAPLGGAQFFRNGERLDYKRLDALLLGNSEASKQFRSARSASVIASMLGFAGGFMAGYPLGTALAGGQPNWSLAAVGAGLIGVSLPIQASFTRKARQAVDTYNEGIGGKEQVQHWELKLKGNGLGLAYHF